MRLVCSPGCTFIFGQKTEVVPPISAQIWVYEIEQIEAIRTRPKPLKNHSRRDGTAPTVHTRHVHEHGRRKSAILGRTGPRKTSAILLADFTAGGVAALAPSPAPRRASGLDVIVLYAKAMTERRRVSAVAFLKLVSFVSCSVFRCLFCRLPTVVRCLGHSGGVLSLQAIEKGEKNHGRSISRA